MSKGSCRILCRILPGSWVKILQDPLRKISIPILWAASQNSKGEGVTKNGILRTWGRVHWTGIPKAWGGGGHESTGIFQFGVVNSLISELIRNDSSKDDDLLVNMRHTQLKQHAGSTFQWSWSLEFLC